MPKRVCVEDSGIIHADIRVTSAIMTDWEAYPDWNPFIRNVDVSSRRGRIRMLFTLEWHDGKRGRSLEEFIHARDFPDGSFELRYKYASLPARLGLLRAERSQTLNPLPGGLEYRTVEEYFGILAFLVPVGRVKRGFIRQTLALKAEAEKRAAAGKIGKATS